MLCMLFIDARLPPQEGGATCLSPAAGRSTSHEKELEPDYDKRDSGEDQRESGLRGLRDRH